MVVFRLLLNISPIKSKCQSTEYDRDHVVSNLNRFRSIQQSVDFEHIRISSMWNIPILHTDLIVLELFTHYTTINTFTVYVTPSCALDF